MNCHHCNAIIEIDEPYRIIHGKVLCYPCVSEYRREDEDDEKRERYREMAEENRTLLRWRR